MVAYSLRTWRRNGVACDELLFLPGTAHADSTIGNESHIGLGNATPNSPSSASVWRGLLGGISDQNYSGISMTDTEIGNTTNSLSQQTRLEGDVAAGVGPRNPNGPNDGNKEPDSTNVEKRNHEYRQQAIRSEEIELISRTDPVDSMMNTPEETKVLRSRSSSRDSTISSINEFDDNWDDDPLQSTDDAEYGRIVHTSTSTSENLMLPLRSSHNDKNQNHTRSNSNGVVVDNELAETACPSAGDLTIRAIRSHVVSDIREGQAQISRFGSLFFFRSSTSSTQNAAYAPSGPSVVGAALDLSMPILFNFHLFIQAWNSISENESKTPAKILPMCFLTALTVRLFVPFGRRGRFWSTLRYTLTAPFHRSRFRDSFLGDLLTSLVRPLQDVAFAAAYYITGLYGLITAQYDLSESGDMLESSWVLHTVILPSCALLPLWWKFLQTLRESYDMGHRWPYLGNSLKYLSAALVIMYGMTHPEERGSLSWMFIFSLSYFIRFGGIHSWIGNCSSSCQNLTTV
jgi:EXS family